MGGGGEGCKEHGWSIKDEAEKSPGAWRGAHADTGSQAGAERKPLSPELEEGQEQPLRALGCETPHDWPVDAPGLPHRPNNGAFLNTSPVSSLPRAGSSGFLSFTWDLPSFLWSAAVPLRQPGQFPEGQPGGQAVFHTRWSEACPELSRRCQLPPCWGHWAAWQCPTSVQSPMQLFPQRKQGACRLAILEHGGEGCVCA